MVDDSIIEKNTSSPMATSCLLIAAVALLLGIFVHLVEIGELRGEDDRSAKSVVSKEKKSFDKKVRSVNDILQELNDGLDNAIAGSGSASDDLTGDEEEDEGEAEDEE